MPLKLLYEKNSSYSQRVHYSLLFRHLHYKNNIDTTDIISITNIINILSNTTTGIDDIIC